MWLDIPFVVTTLTLFATWGDSIFIRENCDRASSSRRNEPTEICFAVGGKCPFHNMGGKRAIRQAPCRSSDYQITVNNITNEALDSNPCIPVQDGYPVQYSCLADVANDTIVEPLMVSFNYEVWINEVGATMGIMQNIRALEWSILYNVAVAISLDKCKLSNQRIPRRLARGDDDIPRWRQLQNNSTNVVYLSNQDPSVVNLRTGTLQIVLSLLLSLSLYFC